jgi:hypothetical protein
MSHHNDRLVTLEENLLSVTDRMIGRSEPEVKQHHRQAATTI